MPEGAARQLGIASASGLAALIWFSLGLLAVGSESNLFGDGGMAIVVWGFVAILAAVVTGIGFGLRMASIASERLPAWVPRLEMYTWVALPVWFVLALAVAQI
jgi:hypothetical protein